MIDRGVSLAFRRLATALCVGASTLIATAAADAANITYNTIALTGDIAPGTNGQPLIDLYESFITDSGDVIFSGGTEPHVGPGFPTRGYWIAKNGVLEPVVTFLTPTGLPGDMRFMSIDRLAGDADFVAFRGGAATDGVYPSSVGLWAGNPEDLQLVAHEGDAAPGIDGATFNYYSAPVVGDGGAFAFHNYLNDGDEDTANNRSIWAYTAEGLTLMARGGDAVPQISPSVHLTNLSEPLSGGGKFAFWASAAETDPGTGQSNYKEIIFMGDPANMAPVLWSGQNAPGTESMFNRLGLPDINRHGQIAFNGTVAPPLTHVHSGIWMGDPNDLQLVAQTSDNAPGTAGDARFYNLSAPVLNDHRQVAFTASLSGPTVDSTNDLVIWTGSPDALQLVAREGDLAPGTPSRFLSFGLTYYSSLFLNNRGDLVFSAELTDDKNSTNGDGSIWAWVDDELKLVVRENDLFDVDPSEDEDLRTIMRVALATNAGSSQQRSRTSISPLTDDGLLTFTLFFTDGSSGVFTAQIPEPGTTTLLAMGGLPLLTRRRRAA